MSDFAEKLALYTVLAQDSEVQEALKLLTKKRSTEELKALALDHPGFKEEYQQIKDEARKVIEAAKQDKGVESGKLRVYIDGGFDLLHSGHYNALR